MTIMPILRDRRTHFAGLSALVAGLFCLAGVGCRTVSGPLTHAVLDGPPPDSVMVSERAPCELCKVVLPAYRIEPPDILSIEAITVVPRSPYKLQVLDVVFLQVQGTPEYAPIQGDYPIQLGGFVELGLEYGSVQVAGMTVAEAQQAIENHLRQILAEPRVSVSLAEIASKQQIVGEHLVNPDGTVTLHPYGNVVVVGLTVEEAKAAIESHLSESLQDPVVSVSVFAYDSKVYYVITQGAGRGDRVFRFPITGNETVLDARRRSTAVRFHRPPIGLTQVDPSCSKRPTKPARNSHRLRELASRNAWM